MVPKDLQNGIYCSFPHAVELLNKPYSDLFTILTSYPELETTFPLHGRLERGAQDQLQGQIASAKSPYAHDFPTVVLGDDR